MIDESNTVSPQQLEREGKDLFQKGEYLEAALAFKAAMEAYQAARDELLAAEMANNCSVAYLKKGDAQAALDIVIGTEDIFAAKLDLRRQGMAIGNRGSALEALGDIAGAAKAYQESADILQQAGEQELRAHVLKSLSAIQLRSGKQIDALFTMNSGLDGIKKPTLVQRLLKKLLKIPMKYLG